MRSRLAAGLLVCLVVAGCGTTVPLTSQAGGSSTGGSTGGDGLGDGSSTTGTSGTGTSGTTGTTGTSGDGGSTGGTTTTGSSSGSTSTTGTATTGSTSGGTTGTTSGGTTGGTTGANAVRLRTPLKVGVLTTDLGAALTALGASSGSLTPKDAYKALFSAINSAGGLAGRRLVATYFQVDATAGSYQQAATQACATFQDAKVEVVLSEAASTDYGVAACLAKSGISMIASAPSDKVGLSQAPTVFGGFNPSYDRGYGAVVDGLVASGYLTTKSKIGVVRITCSEITRAYQNTVLPRMKAAHLVSPIEYTVNCASGFSDAGVYSAAMQSAVLKFKTSGVDRVFVLGSQENLLLQYFSEQAQNQGYHPGYALSSSAFPITLIDASTFPQAQLKQVHGVGWHPLGDANTDPKIASEKRCIALSTKGGVKPKDVVETFGLYQACSNAFLLEAALLKGDGHATKSALRASVLALGTSFSSTGIVQGATSFGPGRPDGVQLATEWGYVPSCSCFRYSGAPRVMR